MSAIHPHALFQSIGRNASVASALMESSDLQYQERRSGDGMEANVILLHPGLALARRGWPHDEWEDDVCYPAGK